MVKKSPDAFRTIREVADWLGVPTHVLRFWESKFKQIKPVKGAGARRYYRREDMLLLGGIKVLLHDQGMTIRGAQKMIEDDGVEPVMALSAEPVFDTPGTARKDRRALRQNTSDTTPETPSGPKGGVYDLDALAGSGEAEDTSKVVPFSGQSPEEEAEALASAGEATPEAAATDDGPANTETESETVESEPVAPETSDSEETAPVDAAARDADPQEDTPAPAAPAPPAPSEVVITDTGPDGPSAGMRRAAMGFRASGKTLDVSDRARLGVILRRLRALHDGIAADLAKSAE